MSSVVALDLSLTATGLVVNGGASSIKTKLKDEARLAHLLDTITAAVHNASADLVVLEGLAMASMVGKSHERSALHYMVRVQLYRDKVPFAVIPPATLKKYVSGSGRCDKDAMLISVLKNFPSIVVEDNNQADAVGLYAMAKDFLGEPIAQMPALNRKSLGSVQWPQT